MIVPLLTIPLICGKYYSLKFLQTDSTSLKVICFVLTVHKNHENHVLVTWPVDYEFFLEQVKDIENLHFFMIIWLSWFFR